jgi:hypothetical protein
MKRDMDLIREILVALEENLDPDCSMKVSELVLDDYDQNVLYGHAVLLADAGFVVGNFVPHIYGEYKDFRIDKLDWKGYEFLELTRNKTIWDKAKKFFKESGVGLSVSVLKWLITENQDFLLSFLSG